MSLEVIGNRDININYCNASSLRIFVTKPSFEMKISNSQQESNYQFSTSQREAAITEPPLAAEQCTSRDQISDQEFRQIKETITDLLNLHDSARRQ